MARHVVQWRVVNTFDNNMVNGAMQLTLHNLSALQSVVRHTHNGLSIELFRTMENGEENEKKIKKYGKRKNGRGKGPP